MRDTQDRPGLLHFFGENACTPWQTSTIRKKTAMHSNSELDAADQLWQHWLAGTSLRHLPENHRPDSRAKGYGIQACLPAVSGRQVLGWKIAATSTAGQQHINVSGPLAGRILSGQVLAPGDVVPPHGNRMRVAEPEMAFVMARDLQARPAPYTEAEVMAAVASLHPSLEIPNSRFEVFTAAGEAQLLADNACAHHFMLGPRAPDSWRALDLSRHPVHARVTHRDGRTWTREGSGAAVLGDPRSALTWLVNELSSLGMDLQAEQFVTTGTCMPPMELSEGDQVLADFGVLGRIGLQFGI